jgi:hypothetical protein
MNPYIEQNGELLLAAEAPWIDGAKRETGLLAIHTSSLKGLMQRGQGVAIAQLYGIVIPGLILTRHIFRGLKRPLYCDGSSDGDKTKLVYARRPAFDYVTAVNPATGLLEELKYPPPTGKTFIAIVSPNAHAAAFPQVRGWIDHWNWAEEDSVLAEAPVGWVDRYEERLFTRE